MYSTVYDFVCLYEYWVGEHGRLRLMVVEIEEINGIHDLVGACV